MAYSAKQTSPPSIVSSPEKGHVPSWASAWPSGDYSFLGLWRSSSLPAPWQAAFSCSLPTATFIPVGSKLLEEKEDPNFACTERAPRQETATVNCWPCAWDKCQLPSALSGSVTTWQQVWTGSCPSNGKLMQTGPPEGPSLEPNCHRASLQPLLQLWEGPV